MSSAADDIQSQLQVDNTNVIRAVALLTAEEVSHGLKTWFSSAGMPLLWKSWKGESVERDLTGIWEHQVVTAESEFRWHPRSIATCFQQVNPQQ
jgi:hypothetical protein